MGSSIDAKSFISYGNAKVLVSLFVLISLTITFLFRENIAFRTVFGDVSVTVASCFGAAGMVYALLNAGKQEKNVRIALILMVSGLLFNVLAEIVWTILDVVLHEQPFPSLADGFYLMYYPLFTLGIMFLPADRLSARERNKIIIDIVIILAAAVLIFWDFIIVPILKNGGESPLALALSVAYPILDIVLLFALLELLYRRWNSLHLGPMLFMLAAIVAAIASDISFSMESSAETYVSGGLVDLGFMLSYCFFGLAGVYQAENWRLSPKVTSERTRYDQSVWTRYLPYSGLIAAYLLLTWNQAHLSSVDLSITTWGVGAIIGLVLVRQITALNENNSLYLEARKENEERKAAEEALRVSEAKYRAIFENTGTVMLIVEEDTTISLANEEFEKLTGYTKKETEGKKSWTEFVVKDDLERMISQHGLRRQNPDVALKTYEFRLMNKNGQIKDILLTVDVISGTRKSVASLMDISERKSAEERLASLLRFHNEMLDTAAIWIDMFDAKGCTTFWNLAAERSSGYSRDEVLGHAKIWEWLYPDPEYRSRMIDTVKGMLIRNERLENYETVIRRKDGEERIIRWHSNNFVDKKGKIVGGIGIGDDITEIKRSNEALKDSERRLSDIIDFLPDATFVIDRNGKVISWNRAIEAMTGIEAKDILGKSEYEYAVPFYGVRKPVLIDLVFKSDEEIERNYINIERIGGILVGEAYIPNLKGGEAYLLGTAAALYDSRGNIVGAIESIRNITERRRAEEALRKAHGGLELRVKERTAELESRNAEMERFVYTVSHELRSPLISVGGVLGFLKRDLEIGDEEAVGNDLRLIGSAVTEMDKLLGETLELSRIGRVANPTENVPFGEIVGEALTQTAEWIRWNNVEISVVEDWPVVYADRMRLVEVLSNLIENSVKYMGNQPLPRIEIGYKLDGSLPIFFVRDNGIGIDPSQHDKVFELFYKVGGTTEGTGAGLAIVKRIIEVHGGRIWIESELGKGCTVCFTLPLDTNSASRQ